MSRAREMQGVPAHVEYLKSNDKRRHPAHCIFHEGSGEKRICTNPVGELYLKHCKTSKNCDYYEEEEK